MQPKKKRRNVPLNSAAWLKLRAQVLAEEPLCRTCMASGIVTPATDVDHIHNGTGDFTDDNRREALQPLCASCHSRKTRAEMNGEAVTVPGCDVNGIPLDPSHPWRQPT
ncbi:HNH endonuclease signature motif containing protein [Billgrantia ethanolica]|uniref:HNH endonuclease n=1 Tax=Billgrantia ethanolica TaxID=2733486 RepID=A0ABS9A1I2_9GAMM|nr:HNH endonuclease signature motif containing protein [Halomonas ethanolica]MCE8002153.1 HNH endonuclease [Halomonas ethanolica]